MKDAANSAIAVGGWHDMSFEFGDGFLISDELKSNVKVVQAKVGNAKTD